MGSSLEDNLEPLDFFKGEFLFEVTPLLVLETDGCIP